MTSPQYRDVGAGAQSPVAAHPRPVPPDSALGPSAHDVHAHGSPYVAQAAPQPHAVRPPKTGVAAWLQFFWMYLPVPVVANVAWIAGTLFVWVSNRGESRLGAENARQALNWCLTLNAVLLVLLAATVLSAGFASGWSGQSIPAGDPRLALMTTLLVLFVFVVFGGGLLTLIFGIAGAVKASGGEVFRTRIAVPFIRVPRDELAVAGATAAMR